MARGRFRRRNSYGNQLKALPMEAMYCAGVSLFTFVLYIAIMTGSVYLSGETPRWLGGLGTLGFLVSVIAFIFNVGQMKTKTELKYRAICLGVSSFVMLIWIATLIIGVTRG